MTATRRLRRPTSSWSITNTDGRSRTVQAPFTTTAGALRLGLTIGIVFYALATASDYAYTGWPRTIWWIQASYHVVMIAVMTVIIAAMR